MSNASSAGLPKVSLGWSGAIDSSRRFRNARRSLASLCLALCAPAAFAAPFNYVANYSSNTVSVVDLSTNQIVATVPQTVAATTTAAATPGIGVGPLGVAINPAGTRVYVANYGDSTDLKTNGTIAVVDSDPTSATLNTVIATITVGVRPEIVAVNPAGTAAYVTNSVGNTVSVIDTATNKQTTTIPVPGVPIGVAFTPDGKKAYVTLADKSRVVAIDTTSNTAASTTIALSLGNPVGIVVNPAGTFAYVADYGAGDSGQAGKVSVIDVTKDVEVATIPVGIGPIGMAMAPDGSHVYVSNYQSGTVSIIDTVTNKVTAEMIVGSLPLGISVDSNGAFAYVNLSGGNGVAILDLSANIVRGPITVGSVPNYSAVTSSAGLTVNLNQHGLTGAWYNQSTSGQGIVLESTADANGAGHGRLFAGWFTYDVTAAGGQRWYSLQGDVSSTDKMAALTIYTGTGGNFAAAPSVSPVAVGQATLQFTDCTHGLLRYTFSDGSNRQGFIGLTRLTGGATCTASGDSGMAVAADRYSGSWYNPSTSGQGLILTPYTTSQGSSLFGSWFTYTPNGQQTGGGASQSWFTLQTKQAGPSDSSYTADILAGTGGAFMTPPGSNYKTVTVGTANVAFTTCTTMSITYSFTDGVNKGLSGTLPLVRLGQPPAGCQ
ncbi:beta-propeller fold lactonase family protein [Rudaea cellulosilytica]|uniref:beta-propeller fold lactonase family protein n=1 Tax=Rudaea cellulosilytica TaxID=540746 RepID=UPI0003A3B47B|nr:beta-propeller fold lactonase family protein [Rudaea cellulosilytica]